MSTPSEPEQDKPSEGVDLGKADPTSDAPFDPYRFGKPDHPIPAEYAPPGYTGPTIPAGSPYPPAGQWSGPQHGAPPYGSEPANPFSNPPGTPYGQPAPPQQPYQYPPPGSFGPGAPPPPPYHSYVQPQSGNGKAVAALVLGILSIVCSVFLFFDAIFVVLGLIFALLAMSESKRSGAGRRGMAVAGLVCTIVGAIIATVLTVLIVHAVNQCGGFGSSNEIGWNQCVRDHL
jgi:hypothetical protein